MSKVCSHFLVASQCNLLLSIWPFNKWTSFFIVKCYRLRFQPVSDSTLTSTSLGKCRPLRLSLLQSPASSPYTWFSLLHMFRLASPSNCRFNLIAIVCLCQYRLRAVRAVLPSNKEDMRRLLKLGIAGCTNSNPYVLKKSLNQVINE